LYTSANSSQSSSQMGSDLTSIRAATKQMWQGQGTYGVSGDVLNNTLVAARRIPTTITVDTTTTPNTLTHQASGTIVVAAAAAAGQFTVTMTNIPVDICMPLMAQATGWISVKAGTAAARTTFPITPANAATDCATGSPMIFTAN